MLEKSLEEFWQQFHGISGGISGDKFSIFPYWDDIMKWFPPQHHMLWDVLLITSRPEENKLSEFIYEFLLEVCMEIPRETGFGH